MIRALLQLIASLGIAFFLVAVLYIDILEAPPTLVYERVASSTSPINVAATSTPTIATSTAKNAAVKKAAPERRQILPEAKKDEEKPTASKNEAYRVNNPYAFASKPSEVLNQETRAALVNVFCETAGGPLGTISGSGIIIDPRGVILTNAHVAQYVLLSSQPEISLQCFIRTGSPAQARWKADILYMPAAWVREHAEDIVKSRPKGTGEHDYALLLITHSADSVPLPQSFPSLPFDSREAIAFTSDTVFLAGYPAEFASGGATRSTLYPSSVFTKIGDLLTFAENSVDVISLGSIALAQSGSSGGAAVNLWGQLVGLISTTSEGTTTADRELRAITLSYISRDILRETGLSLNSFLADNPYTKATEFMANEAPLLAKQFLSNIVTR